MKRIFIVLLLCSVGMSCQGCSYKALTSGLYIGIQEEQRRKCYEPNQSDVQRCLDRVNGMTYDDYNKVRDETAKRSN